MRLWDLRKLANFQTIQCDAPVGAVHFDASAKFLLVGSSALGVYETKTWGAVATFAEQSGGLTGACFGPAATSLTCASDQGVVKYYAAN